MKHVKAFSLKLLIATIAISQIFGTIYGASLGDLIIIIGITTVASYLIGDLIILRFTSNSIASILDFGLSMFLLWILGISFFGGDIPIVRLSAFTAFFIALTEPLIHRILIMYDNPNDKIRPGAELTTELSEEIKPNQENKK
ncbi:hypothetical protein J416_11897 [Gracilibacillus halophilus YIM-C55.5]|uniref:Integral inner membrane protein n=1 Tax=Gracilibacillus halophilus YIM-C55.5 TaxID=1308866 RepID=N4WNZ0_9BACI|nr:DUF2512 family protein [Gracilibacillus halophilus]ENH96205.1 hypothetical protein J416_11897 [Gracilibacillus halophilus YIM-C55.5]